MIHSEIAAIEEADRLAIRELVDAYQATMHFNGQTTIVLDATVRPARATASPTTCSPQMASAS